MLSPRTPSSSGAALLSSWTAEGSAGRVRPGLSPPAQALQSPRRSTQARNAACPSPAGRQPREGVLCLSLLDLTTVLGGRSGHQPPSQEATGALEPRARVKACPFLSQELAARGPFHGAVGGAALSH